MHRELRNCERKHIMAKCRAAARPEAKCLLEPRNKWKQGRWDKCENLAHVYECESDSSGEDMYGTVSAQANSFFYHMVFPMIKDPSVQRLPLLERPATSGSRWYKNITSLSTSKTMPQRSFCLALGEVAYWGTPLYLKDPPRTLPVWLYTFIYFHFTGQPSRGQH